MEEVHFSREYLESGTRNKDVEDFEILEEIASKLHDDPAKFQLTDSNTKENLEVDDISEAHDTKMDDKLEAHDTKVDDNFATDSSLDFINNLDLETPRSEARFFTGVQEWAGMTNYSLTCMKTCWKLASEARSKWSPSEFNITFHKLPHMHFNNTKHNSSSTCVSRDSQHFTFFF